MCGTVVIRRQKRNYYEPTRQRNKISGPPHIDCEHEGVRHSCDQCDDKTKRKDNLKRHKDYVQL